MSRGFLKKRKTKTKEDKRYTENEKFTEQGKQKDVERGGVRERAKK